jgi:predicted O-methyltransferase YrrM
MKTIKKWDEIVPNLFGFKRFYQFITHDYLQDNMRVVEIGNYTGASIIYIAQTMKTKGVRNFKIDGIDPGNAAAAERDGHRLFLENVVTCDVQDILTPITDTSHNAVANYKDESLDFVFIDGDHSYEGVKTDIIDWWPKVKPNGILSGDDYNYPGIPGVKRAVDELLGTSWRSDFMDDACKAWYIFKTRTPLPLK